MPDVSNSVVAAQPKRGLIVLLFTLFGGAIGGIVVVFTGIIASSSLPDTMPQTIPMDAVVLLIAGILFMALMGAFFGTLLGFPAALVTGVAYAWAPRILQRVIVAPLLGGAVSYGIAVTLGFGRSMHAGGWDHAYVIGGAAAAFACAGLVRVVGIDALSAERNARSA